MRVRHAPECLSIKNRPFRANAGRLLRGGHGDCQAARGWNRRNRTVPARSPPRHRLPQKTVVRKIEPDVDSGKMQHGPHCAARTNTPALFLPRTGEWDADIVQAHVSGFRERSPRARPRKHERTGRKGGALRPAVLIPRGPPHSVGDRASPRRTPRGTGLLGARYARTGQRIAYAGGRDAQHSVGDDVHTCQIRSSGHI